MQKVILNLMTDYETKKKKIPSKSFGKYCKIVDYLYLKLIIYLKSFNRFTEKLPID